jgi:hypothetical protein
VYSAFSNRISIPGNVQLYRDLTQFDCVASERSRGIRKYGVIFYEFRGCGN